MKKNLLSVLGSLVLVGGAFGAVKPDATAKDAMNYRFTVCGTPIVFADHKIDWNANPTYNNYCEWPWQFARHWFLRNLADYYVASGDERAAQTWVDIVTSFIDNAPPPPPGTRYGATKSWRTLDTGLRASVWALSFPKIEKSPAVTPAFRAKFFASIGDHVKRLRPPRVSNNWRLMELHGLLDLALTFSHLPEADAWREQAERELTVELARQVYPDGFHFELTSGYHGIVHETYYPLCKRYRELGLPVPVGFTNNLANAYGLYLKLARPDGRLPAINDGGYTGIKGYLKCAHEFFPNRDDFLWGSTLGKEGKEPDFLSLALPYSGAVVFRTSWRPDAVWGYVDMSPWGYGHQHEDKLNFVLFAYGKSLLAEGGTFHYDSSPMRHYVLSTRSHNTIRIDGMDQCARASWKWREDMLYKKAPLSFSTTAARDVAKATFDLGYGSVRKLDRSVKHTRTVEFIKDAPEGPYFRITDELVSSDAREHAYEQLWHLEDCSFTMEKRAFTGDFGGVRLKAAFACEGTDGKLIDQIGQEKPYQGWLPKGSQATRVHRAVHTPTLVGTFKGRAKLVAEFRPSRSDKE